MNFMPVPAGQGGSGLAVRLSDKLSLPVPADRARRAISHMSTRS